jgi:hypothetical protein
MSSNSKVPPILLLRTYTWRHCIAAVAFALGVVVAWASLSYYLSPSLPTTRVNFIADHRAVAILFFWSFVPPAWFFVEYFVVWGNGSEAELKRVGDGQKLAQPFWAAILATLLFLVPK